MKRSIFCHDEMQFCAYFMVGVCVCVWGFFFSFIFKCLFINTTTQWKGGLSLCLLQEISAELQAPIWLLLCDHCQCRRLPPPKIQSQAQPGLSQSLLLKWEVLSNFPRTVKNLFNLLQFCTGTCLGFCGEKLWGVLKTFLRILILYSTQPRNRG